jgi:translation initiation factor 1A
MAINKKGGKKHKKCGNKHRENTNIGTKKVELAEDGQEYAKIIRRVGGARLEVECTDGKLRQAIIPGKFKKRIWMNPGDIVLVSIDAIGNPNVCSIDKKYLPREIFVLKQKGLIKFEDDEETVNENFEFKTETEIVNPDSKIEPQVIHNINYESDEDGYEYYSDEDNLPIVNKNKNKDNSDSLDLDDI